MEEGLRHNHKLIYNILLGITKAKMRSLENVLESELEEKDIKYSDFILKSYSPKIFNSIRQITGSEYENIESEISTDYILSSEFDKKKDKMIFYSQNFKFVIKIISKIEKNILMCILPEYCVFLSENTSSLITRYFGCYRIKVGGFSPVYFVIMNNILPPNRRPVDIYDLKGSEHGRKGNKTDMFSVLKDIDWCKNKTKLFLSHKRMNFISQLKRDTEFLRDHKIMDYSLFIAIATNGTLDCSIEQNELNSNICVKSKDEDEFEILPFRFPITNEFNSSNSIFSKEYGGYSSDNNSTAFKEIYYIGIIDILTPWSWKKMIENFFYKFFCMKNFSCVEPKVYRKRMLKFVKEHLFYNKIN
ncbi:phosphatidylinositol-4-phosphate 5-kinase [Hamiltosporidium tvaerminnensis]|uniref:Phosphatidylinositol-4-phosphate 5-kinase n=1 Tax=Hamiltosporidium tvaerminnensis TaxID=1176355 RepID=A0A4Q9L7S4_9MICR|nr:Phosphatidylinositol-4-phosphate 5-kinase [Hamiltosporidium tvaerminnensis]TBU03614.1 phosphatidylinositol-4-phosphate 5-kinase [Hamiltosporidium tvaerminnensis]TBU20921.1 phosphatidylinositol-4-phosphate 5-kinase [Hamiltosporidium tvaerminnensis]